MKVVLDTNVIVSAILFGGKPRQIMEAVLAGEIQLCVSESMMAELQGVLRRPKFEFDSQIVQSIISEITMLAEWVIPQKHFNLVKDDPADNEVIDCAIEGGADYIISGDRHLLQLERCGETRLISPDEFNKVRPKRQ